MKSLFLATALVAAGASAAVAADHTLLVCDLNIGVPCFTLKMESDIACTSAGKAIGDALSVSSAARVWCVNVLSGAADEVERSDSSLP